MTDAADGAASPLNDIDKHVGAVVRAERIRLGMSLSGLAAELRISPQALETMERGDGRIDHGMLCAMAGIFGVTEAHFYQGFSRHAVLQPGSGGAGACRSATVH